MKSLCLADSRRGAIALLTLPKLRPLQGHSVLLWHLIHFTALKIIFNFCWKTVVLREETIGVRVM